MGFDNFEALLFLKINKNLWKSIDLAEADKARSRSITAANLEDELQDEDKSMYECNHTNVEDILKEEEVYK